MYLMLTIITETIQLCTILQSNINWCITQNISNYLKHVYKLNNKNKFDKTLLHVHVNESKST